MNLFGCFRNLFSDFKIDLNDEKYKYSEMPIYRPHWSVNEGFNYEVCKWGVSGMISEKWLSIDEYSHLPTSLVGK
jgi:hypothetical protein